MEITVEQSFRALHQAVAKATEIGVAANVIITDIAGHMKLFIRMDDAWLGSMDIAIKKAKTAMLFRTNSEAVGKILTPEAKAYVMNNTNGGLLAFEGGMPVRSGEQIVAYIGVSGGTSEQDFQIASAGSSI